MAPSKLSDADKQTILELYRQPEETTSTLAERYGVSNSTISRLLKSQLPEAEYAALIQQKRAGEKAAAEAQPASTAAPAAPVDPLPTVAEVSPPVEAAVEAAAEAAPVVPAPRKIDPPRRRVRPESPPESPPESRSESRAQSSMPTAAPEPAAATQLPLLADKSALDAPVTSAAADYGLPPVGTAAEDELDTLPMAQEEAIAAVIADRQEAEGGYSEEDDLDDDMEDDLDDDYDEEGEDGEDFDDDEDLGNWKFSKEGTPQLQKVQITPLTPAALPRLCYVVVERNSSELVTCPLRDFAELGQIPEGEIDSRTLPVFDNHRVARRFSRRNQRVVKVPDGTMLQKTSPYLQAKGITRLLIDGQIYALEAVPVLDEDIEFEED